MKCTIEAFLSALGVTCIESDLSGATKFQFKDWIFLVAKNESNSFRFQVCQPKSISAASHFKSNQTWQTLTTAINVSRSKDAKRIASEFERRFEWSKLAEYKSELLTEDLNYTESADDSLKKFKALSEILGSNSYQKSPTQFSVNFPSGPWYGAVTIEHGSIEFHLRGIKDIELAKKLSLIVREHYNLILNDVK